MWQTPNSPGGPPAPGKKRRRSKRIFHIKRMDALCEIFKYGESDNGALTEVVATTKVRLILNDFSPKGVGFFASVSLIPGQDVRLTITEPKKLVLLAKLVWCQEHNLNSHIISKELYAFRAGAEFIFKSPEESQQLELLLTEIQSQHLF